MQVWKIKNQKWFYEKMAKMAILKKASSPMLRNDADQVLYTKIVYWKLIRLDTQQISNIATWHGPHSFSHYVHNLTGVGPRWLKPNFILGLRVIGSTVGRSGNRRIEAKQNNNNPSSVSRLPGPKIVCSNLNIHTFTQIQCPYHKQTFCNLSPLPFTCNYKLQFLFFHTHVVTNYNSLLSAVYNSILSSQQNFYQIDNHPDNKNSNIYLSSPASLACS